MFSLRLTPSGVAAFVAISNRANRSGAVKRRFRPGDFRYRDFLSRHRVSTLISIILRPYLPLPDKRGSTGIKYYKVPAPASGGKGFYESRCRPPDCGEHAAHFSQVARSSKSSGLAHILDRPANHCMSVYAETLRPLVVRRCQFPRLFIRAACVETAP